MCYAPASDILHSAFCTLHSGRPRPAFTLVELLVVIAILSIVTIAAIPMVVPALSSRAVREAARIVNTQFSAAQAQALASGHSVGVWINRLAGATDGAMDMYMAEVPQPYAGDSVTSLATVLQAPVTTPAAPRYYVQLLTTDTSWVGLPIRPGDLIRFNYRGPWYSVAGDSLEYQNQLLQNDTTTVKNTMGTDSQGKYIATSPNTIIAIDRIRTSTQPAVPGHTWTQAQPEYLSCLMPQLNVPMPYQIVRRPVRSVGSPVSLPTGAVIDFAFSGTASTPQLLNTTTGPAIITFNRSGALENLYYADSSGNQKILWLTEPLYLLIGKREQLSLLETDVTKQNWSDLESLWVGINPQSGLASTAETSATSSGSFDATTAATLRSAAQAAQSTGGR